MRQVARFRTEISLATLFAMAAIATVIWPAWFETLTGWEPDGGSGELEVWLVAALAGLSVFAATLAGREYRPLSLSQQR